MGQTFEIIPEPRKLEIQPGAKSKVTFTLTNTKPVAMDVQVSVDFGDDPPADWIKISGPALRSVGANGVEPIEIEVAPPENVGNLIVACKLVAAAIDKPEENWAASPEVRIQVGHVAPPPPWKKILLAVAVVLLLGGAIGLAVKMAGGSGCKTNADCPETGFCGGDEGCVRPPVHTACREGRACFPEQTCKALSGVDLCFWNVGQSCDKDSECIDGWCQHGQCKKFDGTCKTGDDCLASQACTAGACLFKDGQECGTNQSCVSGQCKDGKCASGASEVANRCDKVRCPSGHWCHPKFGRCLAVANITEFPLQAERTEIMKSAAEAVIRLKAVQAQKTGFEKKKAIKGIAPQ